MQKKDIALLAFPVVIGVTLSAWVIFYSHSRLIIFLLMCFYLLLIVGVAAIVLFIYRKLEQRSLYLEDYLETKRWEIQALFNI